jgi:hypothetical protein
VDCRKFSIFIFVILCKSLKFWATDSCLKIRVLLKEDGTVPLFNFCLSKNLYSVVWLNFLSPIWTCLLIEQVPFCFFQRKESCFFSVTINYV